MMFHSVSPGSGTGAGRWALHCTPQLKDWLPIAAPSPQAPAQSTACPLSPIIPLLHLNYAENLIF